MPFGLFDALYRQRTLWTGLLLIALVGMGLGGRASAEGFFITEENVAVYQNLPDIEKQLYGHDYLDQSVSQRLGRIERTLFGAVQRGPNEQRMRQVDAKVSEKRTQALKAEQEPMLVYLEEKLFQRTYPDKSTGERLRQLEIQVFGHAFDSYPVEIRMKKLTYAMPVMAREIRLSKGDTVIASAGRVSRRAPRSPSPKVDVVQLDAAEGNQWVHPNGASISMGDYSQSIYHEASGGVLRWRKLPIKVYLKPGEPEGNLANQAMQAWKGVFSLQVVPVSSQADVIVTWDKMTWDMDTLGLLTRPVVQVDELRNIRTVILISLYPLKGLSEADQLHGVSHQLGHAFGLWGHSDRPGDVMYPSLKVEASDFPMRWSWRSTKAGGMASVKPTFPDESRDFHPSQRDLNTLLKIYDQPLIDLSTYSPY